MIAQLFCQLPLINTIILFFFHDHILEDHAAIRNDTSPQPKLVKPLNILSHCLPGIDSLLLLVRSVSVDARVTDALIASVLLFLPHLLAPFREIAHNSTHTHMFQNNAE
eukprot:TRINITY_DN25964_c0_g1_i2.p1 TRINITY_DN25964_c0_g1~~TRINITY_DN25964_c0_g1_i2.p1  ORF type:complete len:109 (+),score=11.57 TRINITY_DN25964_c0_g1_i2:208-534(+)